MASSTVRANSFRAEASWSWVSTPVSGKYPSLGCGVLLAACQSAIGTW